MEQGISRNFRIILGGIFILVVLFMADAGQPIQAQPLAVDFDCAAQNDISQGECEALVALYNATGGDNWLNHTGWLVNDNPCTWYGVACSEGGVVAIDLYSNNLAGGLPLEIGGFPNLNTMTLNDNPLTGPMPITITFLKLDLFHFHNTSICEPNDPTFKTWFENIVYRFSSGQMCDDSAPDETPSSDEVLWPQQTMTAMAAQATENARANTPTPEPSPTKYYTLKTPTPTKPPAAENEEDADNTASGEDNGDNENPDEEKQGFLSNIPPTWLLMIAVPLLLIVAGIYLEVRDRRKDDDKTKDAYEYDADDLMDFGSPPTGAEPEEHQPQADGEDDEDDDYDDLDALSFLDE